MFPAWTRSGAGVSGGGSGSWVAVAEAGVLGGESGPGGVGLAAFSRSSPVLASGALPAQAVRRARESSRAMMRRRIFPPYSEPSGSLVPWDFVFLPSWPVFSPGTGGVHVTVGEVPGCALCRLGFRRPGQFASGPAPCSEEGVLVGDDGHVGEWPQWKSWSLWFFRESGRLVWLARLEGVAQQRHGSPPLAGSRVSPVGFLRVHPQPRFSGSFDERHHAAERFNTLVREHSDQGMGVGSPACAPVANSLTKSEHRE